MRIKEVKWPRTNEVGLRWADREVLRDNSLRRVRQDLLRTAVLKKPWGRLQYIGAEKSPQ